MEHLQGREEEIALLEASVRAPGSSFIAIYGRRRVGKTFLIDNVLKQKLDFRITGIQGVGTREQLINFSNKISTHFKVVESDSAPGNWQDAFEQLKKLLARKKGKKKKIIFFDELPWLATPKSNFLTMLAHFWNDWAVRNNVMLIVCGSAATWMIQKVVHNKGGLHNRITCRIHLKPFNLKETKAYFKSRRILFDHYQIVQIYMMLGGIPLYLNEVKKGESVAQNIDRICFAKQGFLRDEFDKLYRSLYDNPGNHFAVIHALSSKWKGLTRREIVKHTGLVDGGRITRVLDELEQSDFISTNLPLLNKKKDTLYRLTDAYSLFYLKFISGNKRSGKGTFSSISQSSIFKSWSGYAFENVCFLHQHEIKKSMGIAGVYTTFSSYIFKGSEDYPGIQIDMVIDRADGIINVCEMKFHNARFTITSDYAKKLRQKLATFKEISKVKKSLFLTIISSFGINENKHSLDLVQNNITIDSLFE
ncbi:MAG: ATP-binding protein [Bacteroidota bacterium]|nr:ATP-binding protein [Bacteroidota bacterium]